MTNRNLEITQAVRELQSEVERAAIVAIRVLEVRYPEADVEFTNTVYKETLKREIVRLLSLSVGAGPYESERPLPVGLKPIDGAAEGEIHDGRLPPHERRPCPELEFGGTTFRGKGEEK
jgi:hypothetical protein